MAVGNRYFNGILAFGHGANDKMVAYAAIALGVILVVYFLLGSTDGGKTAKKSASKSPAKAATVRSATPTKRASRSKSPAASPKEASPEPSSTVKRSARLRSRTPKKK